MALMLTVVGFGITIWQLLRTQTAVKAANKATEHLRNRLSRQSALIHAASAIAQLKTTQRELRAADWGASLDAMEGLREILLILYRRTDHVDEELRKQLSPFLKDLLAFTTYLDRRGTATVSDQKRATMSKRLRELSSLVTNLFDHLTEGSR